MLCAVHKARLAEALLCSLVLSGMSCGGRSNRPPPPPSGPQTCSVANAGPLIGRVYDGRVAPVAEGGTIADGVYDVTQVVFFRPTPGSESPEPIMRWALGFRTDETSSNHAEGSIASAIELAPAVQCTQGRFSASGATFRTAGLGQKKHEIWGYTASPGGLMLTTNPKGGPSADVFFFRLRR